MFTCSDFMVYYYLAILGNPLLIALLKQTFMQLKLLKWWDWNFFNGEWLNKFMYLKYFVCHIYT